jgi:chorismate mutase
MKPNKETPEQRTVRVAREALVMANKALRKRCLVEIGKLKKKRGGLNTYITKREEQLSKMTEELDKKEDELDAKRDEESDIDDKIIALTEELDAALFEIDPIDGEDEIDYSVDYREHVIPYDGSKLEALLVQRDSIPLKSTEPTPTALADSFTEQVSPFVIPIGCHHTVEANCKELLSGVLRDETILPILEDWWTYPESSLIYSDCLYYLYGVEIPERKLTLIERARVIDKLIPYFTNKA